MEHLALVARLKEGVEPQAAELIASGPPFDPDVTGFERHSVSLSSSEVVFVFEAQEVEWLADSLVGEPFHRMLHEAFDRWRPLVEGEPRIAREQFFWERPMSGQRG